jgi:hypothetical protein
MISFMAKYTIVQNSILPVLSTEVEYVRCNTCQNNAAGRAVEDGAGVVSAKSFSFAAEFQLVGSNVEVTTEAVVSTVTVNRP